MKTIELCKLAQELIQKQYPGRNFHNFEINQTENDGVNAYLSFDSAEYDFRLFPNAYNNAVILEYMGRYDDMYFDLYQEEFDDAEEQLEFLEDAINYL